MDSKHHVSTIFRMKYLKGGPLRNISSTNTPLGSAIWNSCRKGLEFFSQRLFRVPGNGMKTLLWEDHISGNIPFSCLSYFWANGFVKKQRFINVGRHLYLGKLWILGRLEHSKSPSHTQFSKFTAALPSLWFSSGSPFSKRSVGLGSRWLLFSS